MMEKQNRTIPKQAAGDSGTLDDLVEFATGKFQKVHKTDPRKREKGSDEPVPCDTPIRG